MTRRALDRNELIDHIGSLEAHLPDGQRFEIEIAGGAALVLQHLRGTTGTTGDVDAVDRLPTAVVSAARQVAADRGLAADWLNARWLPSVPMTADSATCCTRRIG